MENEEARRLLAMKTKEAMKPKFFTKFVEDDLSGNRAGFIQPGTVAGMNAFGGFIVSKIPHADLYITNHISRRKQRGLLQVPDHSLAKLLVCLRMSSLTRSLNALGDITTGL